MFLGLKTCNRALVHYFVHHRSRNSVEVWHCESELISHMGQVVEKSCDSYCRPFLHRIIGGITHERFLVPAGECFACITHHIIVKVPFIALIFQFTSLIWTRVKVKQKSQYSSFPHLTYTRTGTDVINIDRSKSSSWRIPIMRHHKLIFLPCSTTCRYLGQFFPIWERWNGIWTPGTCQASHISYNQCLTIVSLSKRLFCTTFEFAVAQMVKHFGQYMFLPYFLYWKLRLSYSLASIFRY